MTGLLSISFDTLEAGPHRREQPFALREFIAGHENRVAVHAAKQLLEDSPHYNPLVFYGPTGTGKTHLVRGLAERWKAGRPRSKTVVSNGNDFAREYVLAVQADAIDDFRQKFRRAQLLVVDDLQQLAGKAEAQGELCRTLDRLLERDTPVLITCSQLPAEVPQLAAELVSRVTGGLVTAIVRPQPSTRAAIARRLAKIHGVTLVEAVVEALVAELDDSPSLATIPELNQAIVSLHAASQKARQPISVEFVRRFRRNQSNDATRPSLRTITASVAKYFKVPTAELKGATRRQHTVYARGIAMFLARELTDHSLDEVGQHFGNRDHTTVLHACRKTAELVKSDAATRLAVEELIRQS